MIYLGKAESEKETENRIPREGVYVCPDLQEEGRGAAVF